jgi:type II secretory pathway pseudopilin PulG
VIRRETHRAAGFTLVELIVVIGIIVLLVGIAIPALIRVVSTGREAAIQADLRAIELALDAYEQDFGDIPRFSTTAGDPLNFAPDRGARLLARAMFGIAPKSDELFDGSDQTPGDAFYLFQDGHGTLEDPVGFRENRVNYNSASPPVLDPADGRTNNDAYTGKVFEPYLSLESFAVSRDDYDIDDTTPDSYGPRSVILNARGKPILYYPARQKSPPLDSVRGYVSSNTGTNRQSGRYNWADNTSTVPAQLSQAYDGLTIFDFRTFARVLGDDNRNGTLDATDGDGAITEPGETPVNADYLLITPGPSDAFVEEVDGTNRAASDLQSNVDLVLPQN